MSTTLRPQPVTTRLTGDADAAAEAHDDDTRSTSTTIIQTRAAMVPGGAVAALSAASVGQGERLPLWSGAPLFAAYGLTFATVGAHFRHPPDIT